MRKLFGVVFFVTLFVFCLGCSGKPKETAEPQQQGAVMREEAVAQEEAQEQQAQQQEAQPAAEKPLVAFDTLQSAIQSNDTEAVRKKLEGDVDVNSQADNEQGFTALMYAAGMGNQEIVSLLLAKNADPNISALDGSVPLHFAARAGNLEIVQMLLDKGADANAQDKSGRTALAWAQKEQHDAVVTLLQGRTTAEAQKPEQVEETEEIKEPEQTEQ